MEELDLVKLKQSVPGFCSEIESSGIASLYGVTDGKAVGTYVEKSFKDFLSARFTFQLGNAASGIDMPSINTDLKVTYYKQPQSSSPFKSARQKVYGLGYNLLVFVYDKTDDQSSRTTLLQVKNVIFIEEGKTSDFQTTQGILDIINRSGNIADLVAFFEERMLPLDEIGMQSLAEEVIVNPPQIGCLTISNALQWRLQYSRAIDLSTKAGYSGVTNLLS